LCRKLAFRFSFPVSIALLSNRMQARTSQGLLVRGGSHTLPFPSLLGGAFFTAIVLALIALRA